MLTKNFLHNLIIAVAAKQTCTEIVNPNFCNTTLKEMSINIFRILMKLISEKPK